MAFLMPWKGKQYGRRALLMTAIGFLMVALMHGASAKPDFEVWYGPDAETPDLTAMFTEPQAWAQARSRISAFKLGPQQIQRQNRKHINSGIDLKNADAFRLLHSWGIGLALAAPALKEWDCIGDRALSGTLVYLKRIREYGGQVRSLALDEPLGAGLYYCKNSLEQTVRKTARYFERMRTAEPHILIGDVEPYPHFSVSKLIQWIHMLLEAGARPDFFHLDVNVRALNVRPDVDAATDMRTLKSFLGRQGIPFGIIIWSGQNPESSDRDYYMHALRWARIVHSAIGAPDHLIIQSWVTRASKRCSETGRECTQTDPKCVQQDPIYCGTKSVPLNLPDNDPSKFTQTRLVNEVVKLFEGS